ncbi:5-methyltetrahydrofolate--homocysteine methyltransferase [Paraglaciecola sp.]|uniref:5-methyltetrahydrofolate--homocysteine methyltransferase n=1 Tax=Paraglaciecola sp. TaxID=1920173 RepID=UPI003EF9CAB0
MNKPISFVGLAVASALLNGCAGDAETTIIEKDPIVTVPVEGDEHNHDEFLIESMGRLAVLSAQSSSLSVIDLDDGALLDDFAVTHAGSRIMSSADHRYVAITARDMDTVDFIDGGLWREDHVEHLHDYAQAPVALSYSLSGSRPTHVGSFEGKMAVFYDGDADAGVPAGVQVVTDADITSENTDLPTVSYTMNMHGVAKAKDDILISTIRREDSESTSNAKILPDQVGVYHWHDGEYELEQTLEHACPDLHGASLNEEHFVFGCADGVLIAHAHDGEEFESDKIVNIEALEGLRIGSVYGHAESELFLGVASSRVTGEQVLVAVNPEAKSMELLEWESDNQAIAYTFNYEGNALVILDAQGVLSKFEVHEHDGELEFEFEAQLDISDEDLANMPEDHNFTMVPAQNGNHLYVADPIAKHVLNIHLEDMEIEGDIELDVVPSNLVWLGIKEADHDHDEHDH